MERILIAEDEATIREFIEINLKRAGYEVVAVQNGQEAIDKCEAEKAEFNLVILDIMMPVKDGMEVCKYIRKKNKLIGIIMLSAKSQEIDKVSALINGADDYIVKPFSTSELLARVDRLLKRIKTTLGGNDKAKSETRLTSGPFVLDFNRKVLMKNEKEIDVSVIEFAILELFLKNKNFVLTREQIKAVVWPQKDIEKSVIDVNIRRIRLKIEDEPTSPKYISTVKGFGFRWNDLKTL